MSRYKQVVEMLHDVDVDLEELVTLKEASLMLGITLPGISNAVDRGRFPTVILDMESSHPYQAHRLLLRDEVIDYIVNRNPR